ncbi:hypothetical protein K443DRAFT_7609 [Laccaria amethystina LaAM-08-1]|uniref:Uncharacterized protein n=1 Tax=Laccaria amethystina LaAM-08-1 TaxID=1095629 RepID=A0A0C9XRZ7_9AGAR|nr:hypothetical protein K443DRAFT_7609 [Laccaria amethystina LaAM-08-1]
MFPQIPPGSPPPAYNNALPPPPFYFPPTQGDEVEFVEPPSPSVSDLEIQIFGHQIAPIHTPHTPSTHNYSSLSRASMPITHSSTPIIPLREAPTIFDTPVVPSHTHTIPSQIPIVPSQECIPIPTTPIAPPTPTPQPKQTRTTAPRGIAHTTRTSTPRPPLHSQPLAPVEDDSTEPSPTEYEIMVWPVKPTRKSASTSRTRKPAAKVDPHALGPGVAGLSGAYLSMIKQLKAPPKNVSGSYIIVRMDEPVKKPIDRTKPWNSANLRTSGAYHPYHITVA